MAPDAPTPRPGAPDERGRSATDLRLAAALVAGGSLLVLVIAALGARNSAAREAPPMPRTAVPARDSALADSLATQGGALMEAHAWKEAERAFEHALALDPTSAHLRARYAHLLMLTRRPIPALRELEQARVRDSLGVQVNLAVGWGHYLAREHVRAIERALVTRAASTAGAVTPVDLAVIALGFGEVDRAFALLTEAEASRVPGLAVVTVDPVFTPFFDDPRFEVFLERLNLAPPPPNEFKKGTPIPR